MKEPVFVITGDKLDDLMFYGCVIFSREALVDPFGFYETEATSQNGTPKAPRKVVFPERYLAPLAQVRRNNIRLYSCFKKTKAH
jgi:hypothetical protein